MTSGKLVLFFKYKPCQYRRKDDKVIDPKYKSALKADFLRAITQVRISQ